MGLVKEYFSRLFNRRNNYYIYEREVSPHVEGMSARELYATQANLHAAISFIADSVSQLPLNVYYRKDETNRVRDRNSVIAKLIYKPNRDQTWYEFINSLVIEYLLAGESIVMVLPDDSASGYQLRLIPNEWITKREYDTNFAPSKLWIRANESNSSVEISTDQFVIFKMYNPGSPATYQSPISSLKQTLSEQIQASRFRTAIWKNGGRSNSYITRPAGVQAWTKEARAAWTEAFRKGYAAGGSNAGAVPILEDGMEWKSVQFSAKEAQYAESVQLSREDVAAAYHINPSLIWHTTTQTYASAKDNARALYADCLGPLLQMIQQRINVFLLPIINADSNIYVEFNLEEKLKGSFEERASIMQSATGAPWLTRNEVRAEYNMQPLEGGDELIIPLNVITGGQASPQDSLPTSYANMYASAKPNTKEAKSLEIDTKPSEDSIKRFNDILDKFFKRQKASIMPKFKAVEDWWDPDRWNAELAEDLLPILMSVSEELGTQIAEELSSIYYSENTEAYLQRLAEIRAEYINQNTYEQIQQAIVNGESIESVFDNRLLAAVLIATGLATSASEFAAREAIEQAEYQGVVSNPKIYKVWHTGENPRPSHQAMDGEKVDYDKPFSNGLKWPHDYGPADETCGCNCWCTVEIIY